MTTYVRAPEAARRLGVTTATLYSYVSRGRVGRTLGSDGRSSLFDLADIDALVASSARPKPAPSTIDVRISTRITQLDERSVRYRDIPVADIIDEPYERVARLLWSATMPPDGETHRFRSQKPTDAPTRAAPPNVMSIIGLAATLDPESTPVDTAEELLTAIVSVAATPDESFSFAEQLVRGWVAQPSPHLARATNSALVLLADHGLATSTLAVRVATSVRSSPPAALIAGLASVEGDLHGGASAHAHRLFEAAENEGATAVLMRLRRERRRVPGFGHKVYRVCDPRFRLLLDRVVELPDPEGRLCVVVDTIRASGALVSRLPNIDLALGALSYVAGLPADNALFAIARIAGWTAHHLEELEEQPVRFRGLAT